MFAEFFCLYGYMTRWLKYLLIIIFLCLLGLGLVYQYGGLKIYYQAIRKINQLPVEDRVIANNNFLNLGDSNLYGGILAGTTSFGIPRIWVWGSRGLRLFKTDKYTVYSFFSICNEEILKLEKKDGTVFTVDRSIFTDINQWKDKFKQGYFVVVMIASEGNGGNIGYAREVKLHDWWAFMPIDISALCGK